MNISFEPISLPHDQEQLINFLTIEMWPYHINEVLNASKVLEMLQQGLFDGTNHQCFWICDESKKQIGFIRLFDLDDIEDGSPLFDLRVSKVYRSQGIGSKAVKWLTNYLFERYPELIRVAGTTRADNKPMRKTFKTCGYVKEGHFRKDWRSSNGELFDTVQYAILREDWSSGQSTSVAWNDESF